MSYVIGLRIVEKIIGEEVGQFPNIAKRIAKRLGLRYDKIEYYYKEKKRAEGWY